MAHRFTLAVPDESGAETLYFRLATYLREAVAGGYARLIRRNKRFIDLDWDQSAGEPDPLPGLVHITANSVADYIVDDLEERIAVEWIAMQYSEYGKEETEEILSFCRVLLSGTCEEAEAAEQPARRKEDIARKAEAYLFCNPYLDIDGFLRFRLSSYVSGLKDTVDYAVEEYLSNKQYQEFIGLLKYFVYFQDAKIPEVHLVHYGGNKYTILDHRMKPVELTRSEEVVVDTIDQELNYEDMIVSTLISASPQHVSIHTREPETLSIKTIRQIFEGRTTLCTCCKLCKPMLGERKAEGAKIT